MKAREYASSILPDGEKWELARKDESEEIILDGSKWGGTSASLSSEIKQATISRMSLSNDRKQGRCIFFTLIELLVVIAIVMILVAIMLPALKSARQTAYSIACSSNLKSFNTAHAVYMNDNQDTVITTHYNSESLDGSTRWFALLYQYLKTPKTFQCPQDTAKRYVNSYPNSYTLNADKEARPNMTVASNAARCPDGQKIAKIKNMSCILFACNINAPLVDNSQSALLMQKNGTFWNESGGKSYIWTHSGASFKAYGRFHNGGSNFALCNGGIRNYKYGEFIGHFDDPVGKKPYSIKLWCVDPQNAF